jgi:hypothetical protein
MIMIKERVLVIEVIIVIPEAGGKRTRMIAI